MKRVVVAGASGLIGRELIKHLLNTAAVTEVIALVRREIPLAHIKLIQIIVDYEKLEEVAAELTGEAVYCCLGTTKAKTPDEVSYKNVDLVYPLKLAQIARRNSVNQFHFISAMGASSDSRIFYNRVKGEAEDELKKLRFNSLYIYRPSLLYGDRLEERSAERLAIQFMNVLNPFLIGGLKKYRSISAEVVARAMVKQTLRNLTGSFILQSNQIAELA